MKTKQTLATLSFLAALLCATTLKATVYHVTTTGGWGTTTTFTPNGNPGAGDDVIVDAGKTLTLGAARLCASMTINGQLTSDNGLTVSGATIVNSGGTSLISSTTGTKTFSGDVTINSGGIWNETAAATMTFGGNVANNGAFTASTGAHTLSGSGKTLSGVLTIPNVTISGSYVNNASLTCDTAIAGAGTLSNGSSGTITAPTGANIIPTLSGFNSTDSTIVYRNNGSTPATATHNNLNLYTSGGNSSLSALTAINGELNIGASTIVNPWPSGTLALGKGLVWNTTGTPVGTVNAVTMGGNLYVGGNGTAVLTINGVISDGGSGYALTKIGTSSLTLNPATPETYTGNTVVNGGTLTLDYANATTPANGIINGASLSPLLFGSGVSAGGVLIVNGKSGATCSQTFNGLTLSGGGNTISNFVNGATSSTLALGAIATRSAGSGNVDFGNSTVAGSITTSSANNSAGILGGWATYLGADWATVSGGTIGALASYTTLPTSGGSSTVNYTSAGTTLTASESGNSLRLTGGTLALGTFALTLGSGASGGLLCNAAANITQSSSSGNIGAGAGNEFIVYVKSGVTLTFNGGTANTLIGANSGGLTKSGPGTMTLNYSGPITLAYTGPTAVHQGILSCPGIGGFSSSTIQVDAGSSITVQNVSWSIGSSAAQTLSGSGTVGGNSGGGALTLGANATLQPGGAGKYGTLTLGGSSGAGVTVSSGATFVFDLSKNPNNTNLNDKVIYNYPSATFTLPSTLNVTINQKDGVLGIGNYVLLDSTPANQNFSQTPTVNPTWAGGSAPASFKFSVVNSRQLVLTVYQSCAPPASFSVTGAGTFCNDIGATLGLANSDATATYQLFRGVTAVGSGVTGTGSALSPAGWASLTTPGTYTVWATNGCGSSALMTGNATVNQAPNTAFNLTGADGCSSPGVTIGLSGSESGVSYQLLKDGSNAGSPVAGTGSAISFGLQTAAGVYTVQGSVAGCTTATMAGSPSSVTITATPNAPTAVSASAGDSQVIVSWTAPGSGPTPTGYNVKRSTISGSGYTTLAAGANVSASPFTDTTAANGTAYYYVVSALNGSCESANSSPEAAATPNPSFSAFTITGNGISQAGVPDQLTITAVDASSAPVTGVSGDIALTFSGLATAPDGSLSTVSDKNGVPRNLGLVTAITFVNGVGSTGSGAAVLIAHKAELATLNVTDGTHSSTSTGGTGLGLAISAAADSAYRISTATSAPVVGATDTLTIGIVDPYQNPSSFTGTKNITFGGLATAPDGSLPTVEGTPFGTPTPITFSSPASAALIAHKVESNKLLTATDGTLTAAGTGGTAPTLSPTVGTAAQLGIFTQPSTTATAGIAFGQQPVIAVLDTFANVVSNSTASVSAAASAGTLQGTASVNANGSNGRATFSGLSLTNTGVITLTFSSSGLPSTNSTAITVSGATFAALAWTAQPGSAVYGAPFGTQPVLKAVDQFGNPTTAGLVSTMNVTVTVSAGGGTLAGTTSYNIGTAGSNGVVAFADLQINGVNGAGAGKQLTASLPPGYGAPVSGATIWLDSSVASSVLTNATGVVTNWQDQSGNARHFGTTISMGAPGNITYASSINGRKVVTFPGTTDAVNGRALQNSTYVNNGNATTYFIATRANNYNTWCGPFSTSSGATDWSSPTAWSIDSGGGVGNVIRVQRNSTAAAAGVRPANTPFVWFGGYGNNRQYVQYLTSSTVSSNSGTYTAASFAINKVSVGARLGNAGGTISDPWVGDVAEVLIYNSYLSDADQATVTSYLSNKWVNASGSAATLAAVAATTATFNVAPATVVPNVTVNNKPYDNTTAATIATRSLSGIVGSDDVNLDTSGTAVFSDENVGTGKTVTITGLSLSGTTAVNYVLSTTSTNATANITARTLTVSAAGISRFNDGTTNASVTLSDDRISGDDLTTAYATAGFEDSARGTNKPVHVFGISITGGLDAGNYALGNTTADTTANIYNNPPVAGTGHFSRPSGISLKIKIVDLLTNATDADLDALSLVGVSATTTNGTPLSTDSTYVFVESNTVADAFGYTVQDGYGGTNSGTVLVSIVATNPGQSQIVVTNGIAEVTFAGIPGYSYTADRATNVFFTGVLRSWATSAPPNGVFKIEDDFSDIGGTPDQGYYRLRYTP